MFSFNTGNDGISSGATFCYNFQLISLNNIIVSLISGKFSGVITFSFLVSNFLIVQLPSLLTTLIGLWKPQGLPCLPSTSRILRISSVFSHLASSDIDMCKIENTRIHSPYSITMRECGTDTRACSLRVCLCYSSRNLVSARQNANYVQNQCGFLRTRDYVSLGKKHTLTSMVHSIEINEYIWTYNFYSLLVFYYCRSFHFPLSFIHCFCFSLSPFFASTCFAHNYHFTAASSLVVILFPNAHTQSTIVYSIWCIWYFCLCVFTHMQMLLLRLQRLWSLSIFSGFRFPQQSNL